MFKMKYLISEELIHFDSMFFKLKIEILFWNSLFHLGNLKFYKKFKKALEIKNGINSLKNENFLWNKQNILTWC